MKLIVSVRSSLKNTRGVWPTDEGGASEPRNAERIIPGVTAEDCGGTPPDGPLDERNSCNIFASSPPQDGVPQSAPLYRLGVNAIPDRWWMGVGRSGLKGFAGRDGLEPGVAISDPDIFRGLGVCSSAGLTK